MATTVCLFHFQEAVRKQKEREDRIKREFDRRMNPNTKEDFDILYHALESKCLHSPIQYKPLPSPFPPPPPPLPSPPSPPLSPPPPPPPSPPLPLSLVWRQDELKHINSTTSGPERKAALCELLEKEAELIASIGRHKNTAQERNREGEMKAFLEKVSICEHNTHTHTHTHTRTHCTYICTHHYTTTCLCTCAHMRTCHLYTLVLATPLIFCPHTYPSP